MCTRPKESRRPGRYDEHEDGGSRMTDYSRREKVLQAITYFVTQTSHCGKAKLYWLLYLLDFKSYAVTLDSVTGLEYYASADGPVPLALEHELNAPREDFVRQFHLDNLVLANGRRMLSLRAQRPFDGAALRGAEASTLFLVARIHADHRATEIGERDLLPTEPWLTTYHRASREFELIDYALARPLTPDPIPRHWMAMPAAGYRRGV